MVADMMEGMRFALGPAMAVRRDAIDAIGGIATVADVTPTFELGNRIWAKLTEWFSRTTLYAMC